MNTSTAIVSIKFELYVGDKSGGPGYFFEFVMTAGGDGGYGGQDDRFDIVTQVREMDKVAT